MLKKIKEKYNRIPKPAKASIWFVICSFLQTGISVITTPIFTRLLSTNEYGDYSVFMSWQAIILAVVALNVYSAVYTRGLVKFEEDKNRFASSLHGLLITLCVFWTIIYTCFSSFWNSLFSLTSIQMYSMLAMIWTSSMFNLWAAEQRVEYKYKGLVVVTAICSFLKPLIGVIFVLIANDKVTARIVGLVLVELFVYSWIVVYEMRKGKCFFSLKYWKYTLFLTIPLLPHYLSQTMLASADRIMIKNMVGSQEAGIYSLAYSIAQITTLFSAAILQSINPWIFKKIKNGLASDIPGVAYGCMIIVAIINILLIAFSPEIVWVFASKEYHDAMWLIPPIAMSVFFMFCYSLFACFEFYYEKTYLISIATILCASVNIGLNYVFIKLFGYQAASYTTLICYVLYTLFHFLSMVIITKNKKRVSNPYSFWRLFVITAFFLIAGFLLMLSYSNVRIRISIIILAVVWILFKKDWIRAFVANLLNLNKKKENER